MGDEAAAVHGENSFGEELKARREQLGLSVKKLAKLSSVSRRASSAPSKAATSPPTS